MNRKQFMEQLKYLLRGISEEERRDAMEYYENYFDEAGPEREASVIEELGSPEKVAAIIFDSICEEDGNGESKDEFKPKRDELKIWKFQFKGDRNKNMILLIVVLIGLCTFALPGIASIGGTTLGIFGVFFGVIIGILCATVGLLAGGVVASVYAIMHMTTSIPEGVLFLGGGFISIAFGILMCMLFVWIVTFLIPRFIRWIVSIFRKEKA